uniref:Crossover junction endonuclease MUS81 n=1 Tax=Triticum aestivum TaxID=4565 RepID=A0A077RZ90_WHEAT|nr:unnamed protein product [Triticum aestivum]
MWLTSGVLLLFGPFTVAGHPAVVLSDSDFDEYGGSSPLIGINKVLKEVDFQTQKQAVPVPVPLGSAEKSLLAMPPHQSNESFLKAYEVVLILDDRDTFGPRSRRKVVDNICSQFNIPVEIKHFPVGEALWIARHKELDTDYVLDFIVERKNVDDLLGSIKDNRYKYQKLRLKIKHFPVGEALWIARHKELDTDYVLDFIVERKNVDDLLGSIKDNRYKYQKLRLKKCGLRKLIYLVEGDLNTVDGSESIKRVCFTTEVLEGFDVQRTTGCSDLEKVTVSDIFALQLMQVPQVTKEAALAIMSLYPTLLLLAKAYTMLNNSTYL